MPLPAAREPSSAPVTLRGQSQALYLSVCWECLGTTCRLCVRHCSLQGATWRQWLSSGAYVPEGRPLRASRRGAVSTCHDQAKVLGERIPRSLGCTWSPICPSSSPQGRTKKPVREVNAPKCHGSHHLLVMQVTISLFGPPLCIDRVGFIRNCEGSETCQVVEMGQTDLCTLCSLNGCPCCHRGPTRRVLCL